MSEFVNKEILYNSADMLNSKRYCRGSRMSRLAFEDDNNDEEDEDYSLLVTSRSNNAMIGDEDAEDEVEEFFEQDYSVVLGENVATNSEISTWKPRRFPAIYNVNLTTRKGVRE
jgi:hypothetical protein